MANGFASNQSDLQILQQFISSNQQPDVNKDEEILNSFIQANQRQQEPQQVEQSQVPEKKKRSRLETAAEIGLPLVGAALGTAFIPGVGTIAGSAIGAGAGRLVEEVGEQLFKKDAAPILPKSLKEFAVGDTALGNVIKEGIFTAAGGKVFQALGPTFSKLGPALRKAGQNTGKIGKVIGDTLEAVIQKIPGNNKEEFIRKFSLQQENTGFLPRVTERVLRRGPKNVLTKSNTRSQQMSQETIDDVSKSFSDILKKRRDQFDDQISPLLKQKIDKLPIENIADDFMEGLDKLIKVTISQKTGKKTISEKVRKVTKSRKTGKESISQKTGEKTISQEGGEQTTSQKVRTVGKKTISETTGTKKTISESRPIIKFTARADIDESTSKDLIEMAELINDISKKPTAKALHSFKQKVNRVLSKNSIKDVPAAQQALFKLNSQTRNLLDTVVPGYKKITNEFRDVFELKEEIGNRLAPNRVEGFLKDFFGKEKVNLQTNIERLMELDKGVSKVLNKAFDERAAKEYVSLVKKGPRGLSIPRTRGIITLPKFGRTPEAFGESLVRKEARGVLGPLKPRIGQALGGALIGDIPGAPRQIFRNQLGNKKKPKQDIIRGLGTSPR